METAIVFVMICMVSMVIGEDTFASTAHMRLAANGELKMRKSLKEYIEYESQRLRDLNR